MKKALFTVFLLLSLSFAAFRVNTIDVDITLDRDGSVHVKEIVNIYIETNADITAYTGSLDKDDLASWASLIGSDEVKLHINREYVDVENLKVRPQPLTNLDPVNERANGRIIITYDANPYVVNATLLEDTGLFISKTIKPRVVEYTLNEKALSFKRTTENSVILDEKTTLWINLPEGIVITDLNPRPLNVDTLNLPLYETSVHWRGSILPDLTLVVELRETLDTEIRVFFETKLTGIVQYMSSFEGMIVAVLLAVVVIFYIVMVRRVFRGPGK